MDKGGLVPGGFQRLKCLNEQGVLLGGVGHIGLVRLIGHGKVLEQAGHLKARQLTGVGHLPDGLFKIRAESKADAAHASVRLEMDLHPAACRAGRFAQSLGLFQRVAGHRDVVPDEVGGAAGVDMAQNQNGQGEPGLPQLQCLGQAAAGQPGGPLLGKDPGTLHGPVAVAVGLDNGAEGQLPGPLLDRPEILPQGVQIDLGPDVFFKNLIWHHKVASFGSKLRTGGHSPRG